MAARTFASSQSEETGGAGAVEGVEPAVVGVLAAVVGVLSGDEVGADSGRTVPSVPSPHPLSIPTTAIAAGMNIFHIARFLRSCQLLPNDRDAHHRCSVDSHGVWLASLLAAGRVQGAGANGPLSHWSMATPVSLLL
jgi:hypothetical protein